MIKKIVSLILSSIKGGTLFSDMYHIIKYKKFSFKDFIVKYKKFSFQKKILKTIKNLGMDYFYSENYLLKKTNYNDIDSFIENLNLKNNNFFPEDIFSLNDKKLINDAEKFCNHYFDLLGSGEVQVCYGMKVAGIEGYAYRPAKSKRGNREFLPDNYKLIDWSIDFKSGYRWNENIFYGDILSYDNDKKASDIKIPWELSRCQHLITLAEAYRLTGNQKYSDEIKYQIIDWINNNRFGYGPNWVCAMDVGIRVSNWLVALEIIKHSEVLNDKVFLRMLSVSIHHHYDYLINNLEWNSNLTSNHYLSDIVGIFFISNYFPHFKNSSKNKTKFKDEIEKEIFKQTYEDGMDFEGSTNYHRLVLELFAYSLLIDLKEDNFSKDYKKRLFKMFQFSAKIIKTDGTIPQIGDNDSGIFLNLANRKLSDHSYLFDLAQKIFSKKDFEILTNDLRKNYSSFKNAGIHIYRSKDIYFLVNNGPNGQNGNGGHSHNDKLSFILDHKKKNLLIDPGTYLYTPFPDMRNLFRSTSSHNTVMVGNQEQNQFIKNYLFGMKENCSQMKSLFRVTDDGFTYSGSHNGYERIDKGLIHKRNIEYSKSKSSIKIIDSFEDSVLQKNLYLITKKNIFEEVKNNQIFLDGVKIKFRNLISIKKKDFPSSEAYGIKKNDSVQLCISFNKSLETFISLPK